MSQLCAKSFVSMLALAAGLEGVNGQFFAPTTRSPTPTSFRDFYDTYWWIYFAVGTTMFIFFMIFVYCWRVQQQARLQQAYGMNPAFATTQTMNYPVASIQYPGQTGFVAQSVPQSKGPVDAVPASYEPTPPPVAFVQQPQYANYGVPNSNLNPQTKQGCIIS